MGVAPPPPAAAAALLPPDRCFCPPLGASAFLRPRLAASRLLPPLPTCAAKVDTRSKAQRKNDKRKEKKVDGPVAGVTQQMAGLRCAGRAHAASCGAALLLLPLDLHQHL